MLSSEKYVPYAPPTTVKEENSTSIFVTDWLTNLYRRGSHAG